MHKFIFVIAVSVMLFASITAAQAQTTDAGAVYRQFQEAINRGEVDAAAALLTDDATWLRPPACRPDPCMGKPRIRQEILRQIGDHNQATAFSAETREGTVVVRYELRSDATRMLGFERRIILDTVTVRDGKIRSIVYGADMSDSQTAAFEAATAPAPK